MPIVREAGMNNQIKITAHQGFNIVYRTEDVLIEINQESPVKDRFKLLFQIKPEDDDTGRTILFYTDKKAMEKILVGIQFCCQAMRGKLSKHSLKELNPTVEEAKA